VPSLRLWPDLAGTAWEAEYRAHAVLTRTAGWLPGRTGRGLRLTLWVDQIHGAHHINTEHQQSQYQPGAETDLRAQLASPITCWVEYANDTTPSLVFGGGARKAVGMSTTKYLVTQVMGDLMNVGWLAVIDQVATDDLCVHYPQADIPLCGRAAVRRAFSRARAAFPDAYFLIDDMLSSSDQAMLRWTGRATHRGVFWGMPSTEAG
jgi:hypothetical protein